jgi:heterodisulfide reductase subunit A
MTKKPQKLPAEDAAKGIQGSVMVIGAGVAGMQAALDVAEQGFRVYIVEKSPSIGGRMAQLDKTFPTNDCAMCTEGPKMVEVLRHPNIELLTYSEVKKVSGSVGNFKVTVKRKARYVDESKCIGCGKCAEVCRMKGRFPNEFDMGISRRGAVYVPFPQASPLIYTIDGENCIFITKGKCGGEPQPACVSACERNAINLQQKESEVELDVGTIIVATGFDVLEPKALKEFGYGTYKNVLTALQYERLISASGPTSGRIIRPSDGKEPHKIAWIQCVGSRGANLGNAYCSRICCMYATKEALVTMDHHPEAKPRIFYIDVRAYGKGFEEYYKRAEKAGVTYIRGIPGEVREKKNGNLIVKYENTLKGQAEEEEVELLVLSSAMNPSASNRELASVLGIELDDAGFFKEKSPHAPLETTREGIFVCGCAQGPKDIPDSISQALGAASKAAIPIKDARGREVAKAARAKEKIVPAGEPRIGIVVCHCGMNIAGFVDVKKVVEYAKQIPNVVYAEDAMFACSDDSQSKIKNAIKEHHLNRFVVAACSPTTHEALFQATCENAGLNKYLFEMANIRNHCSWVHSQEPALATKKSKDLVRIAVAKATLQEPLEGSLINVNPSCAVIGGGISGMTAALNLANAGYEANLIERDSELGGSLRKIYKLFPTDAKASDVLEPAVKSVKSNPHIKVHLGTEVKKVSGYVGNYELALGDGKTLKVGTIIIATGSEEIEPTGYYGYGKYKNVVTQTQLEKMLAERSLKEPKNVVFINCVGSREDVGRTYCCRIGCGTSVKNAKYIKQLYPKSKVFVLYRDMRVLGRDEEYYMNVQEKSRVGFIRYGSDKMPNVEEKDGGIMVKVYDQLLGEFAEINADLLVLTAAIEGSKGCGELAKTLRVPTGAGNFFLEVHQKIRPLDFATDGIFMCGSAHYPKSVSECIAQACGAASRAATILSKKEIESEAITSVVDKEKCIGCGICENLCPYLAMRLEQGKAESLKALCKGCGTCAAACPVKVIVMSHFKDSQIAAQIKAAWAEEGA